MTNSQCWAHNINRQRCTLPAGHDTHHSIAIQWTDDECYDPNTTPAVTHTPTPAPPPPVLAAPAACIACSHKHKGGECKCGCYEFIG